MTTDPSRDPLIVTSLDGRDGLEVYRQPAPAGAASFSASYLGPAGWAYDPPGREGLAVVASALVTSGAGPLGRVDLARELDRLGATFSHHCHPETVELTVWGPEAAFEPLLSILADAVLRPHLTSTDLGRVRRQMYERQLREESQPDHLAERELLRSVFPPGHPYRLTGAGTHRSVARLMRADVRRFHADHFTADGGQVVVTTRQPARAVARAIQGRFRGFSRGSAPPAPRLPPPRSRPAAPRSLAMRGRSQVEIRIGGPTLARDAQEYPALFLANEVLGGRPLLSRLFQRVRERHGLAYHASSEVEAMHWGGHWSVQAGTGPERTGRVLKLLRAEIRSIAEAPVPASELERIRESAIGELPLSLETTPGAHEIALDVAYHHLPPDYYRTWPAALRALRPRDVRDAAAQGLDPHRSATVVAGPTSPSRT